MCELSVDDERQQREQDDGDKLWHDNWNKWDEHCVQNEMTNGHKIENWVHNEMTDSHKIELMDGHKSWNNRIWHRNGIQNKLTGGHNIRSRNWQDNWMCNILTVRSIESVGQGVGVRAERRCRRITFGVDVVIGTLTLEYCTRQLASLLYGMRVDV